MSIHMFIVAFDAVAIRFLGRLLLHCTWLWISMIDDSCCFSSAGPVLKAWRTYSCRLLGKRERQEVMVRCLCSPTLNCNLSKSVFACPYFILDISHPPVFPLLPLSPHSSCPYLFHGMQYIQKHPWPVESWFMKTHKKLFYIQKYLTSQPFTWQKVHESFNKSWISAFLFQLRSKKCREFKTTYVMIKWNSKLL